MKLMHKTARRWLAGFAVPAALTVTPKAEPLKLGYSDRPGWTLPEIANQKGWFKEAGVATELVWFDHSASLDAFPPERLMGSPWFQPRLW